MRESNLKVENFRNGFTDYEKLQSADFCHGPVFTDKAFL